MMGEEAVEVDERDSSAGSSGGSDMEFDGLGRVADDRGAGSRGHS